MRAINMVVLIPGLVLALALGLIGSAFGADFEIEVLAYPDEIVPALATETWVQVRNVSGHSITFARQVLAPKIEVRREDGSRIAPCEPLQIFGETTLPPRDWKGLIIPGAWEHTFKNDLCFDSPGEYTVQFGIESHGPYRNENGKEYSAWEGDVSTPILKIVVRALEGVDREVYETYKDYLYYSMTGQRLSELLQRFPTSTYAAYVIWQIHAKGWAGGKLDGILAFLNSGLKYERGLLPCSLDGKVADHETRLDGVAHIRCRDNWLQLVLKNHPDIWFAEEIQLRLATDAYLLQDKAACAAGLEALSEHAKPYVAEKARALLEAMQSKNMLPGGPKDLTAAPAPAEPEGKTAQ